MMRHNASILFYSCTERLASQGAASFAAILVKAIVRSEFILSSFLHRRDLYALTTALHNDG
jgi:hypothetical protein